MGTPAGKTQTVRSQPLESGEVTIVRANHRATYPARFMLVGAMNPCRCGKANDPGFSCRRGANERCAADYQGRLSGPLIDRIDLHIEVPAVTAADLMPAHLQIACKQATQDRIVLNQQDACSRHAQCLLS